MVLQWFYITLTMGHSESSGSQGMLDSVAKQLCSRLGLAPPLFLGVLQSGGFLGQGMYRDAEGRKEL